MVIYNSGKQKNQVKQTKVLHQMWCFGMVPFLPGKLDTINDCSKVSGARFKDVVCTEAVSFGGNNPHFRETHLA